MFIVGDMNAYSPIWNPHYYIRKNVGPLKELIDSYELLVNNNFDYVTCPLSQDMLSIIYLALSSPKLGPLAIWKILQENLSLLDYELILLE